MKSARVAKADHNWKLADDAYAGALQRAFGVDAGKRRLDADDSDHPLECRLARLNYHRARYAYEKAHAEERTHES